MTDITKHLPTQTVQRIYESYVANREPAHRMHLGGSQIGHHCTRYLWLQFHWAGHEEHDVRKLRLFDHGNHEEPRLVADLRATGAKVYDVDPASGRQFSFPAFGGHFGISLDGCTQGIPESSAWHVLEFKTANDKSFAGTKKKGVEKDKPQHYVQMQIGMHLSGMERALYLIVNKNTDDLYMERATYIKKTAERYMDRAERIIFSEDASDTQKISDDPAWYQCKMCPMHALCHTGGNAEVNCRTCLHSTAQRDGTWHCAKHDTTLDEATQRAGCGDHLYRPGLVGIGKAVDAGDDFVEYQATTTAGGRPGATFRNGPYGRHSYTSREIEHAAALPLSDDMEALRMGMGAELQELSHEPAATHD